MKSLLRAIAVDTLFLLSRGIVAKYKPQVVMVTGSVGKTSTKDAVAAALAERIYLRASEKSFNSEFGVTLTIIGAKAPWANPFAWLKVYLEALSLLVFPNHYPKMLVLEVGADRPGDLAKILKLVSPAAVVVTRLPDVPVHVEAYADPAEVREEEFAPAYALPHGAPLIMSAEDGYARALAKGIHATITLYGYGDDADVRIMDASFKNEGKHPGMTGTIAVASRVHTVHAPGVIGMQQLYAPTAAVAAAVALGLTVEDACAGLKDYAPPPGRARILKGKKDTLLIDDSYNASPAAVEEALSSLALVEGASRRIAVLGDMLELGRFSVEEHERIGRLAAQSADVLMTVGNRSQATLAAARKAGMKESATFDFDASSSAAEYLEGMLTPGDLILIKGPQGMRMERITERLLKDPKDVRKLPRQDKEWKRR